MSVAIHHGDSREVLKSVRDNSVDSCVTDPPYALTSTTKRWANSDRTDGTMPKAPVFARTTAGFMGQKWDNGETAFDPEFWRGVYRVLKPGAHVVAFSGTRTFHRMACAIEDAGFEIRDQIGWAFGSGFPKSHNIGDGLGTALKPAWEPVCLARKPLIGTVAANVREHGTGALNIDGCRVAGAIDSGWSKSGSKASENVAMSGANYARDPKPDSLVGRWPANLIHDGSEEVLAAFPETHSAGSAQGPQEKWADQDDQRMFGKTGCGPNGARIGDDGGSAARFFYTAKADADDRLGSKHPTVRPVDLMQYLVRLVTPKGGLVLDPFAGTGTTGEAAFREGCDAILIEREERFIADIKRRVTLFLAGPDERQREAIKASGRVSDPGPLFDGFAA